MRHQAFLLLRRAARRYRHFTRGQRAALGGLLALLIILTFPSLVLLPSGYGMDAAGTIFYFPQSPSGVSIGQSFPIELRVKTGNQAINAVSAELRFDPHYLEIVTMTTAQSFCTFYTDNTFDSIEGKVLVACGTPNPGYVGDAPIVSVTLRAKASGHTEVTLNPTETLALANDGKGTNLLQNLPNLAVLVNSL